MVFFCTIHRSHVCMTWCLGLVMNIATDFHKVREDIHANLIVGMIMVYFYTSSLTWVCCEAHAIFKALTAGIISARSKVYKPFGYGTPFCIIGKQVSRLSWHFPLFMF